jgi:hypothetical protein
MTRAVALACGSEPQEKNSAEVPALRRGEGITDHASSEKVVDQQPSNGKESHNEARKGANGHRGVKGSHDELTREAQLEIASKQAVFCERSYHEEALK